jgi:hypothetical protein
MPADKPKTIPIFEVVEVIEGAPAMPERPFETRTSLHDRAVQLVETGVDVLSENIANFIEGVTTMLSSGAMVAGPFDIETVEVQCQISGGGKIGFAGTGVDLHGGSTLKIIFKKKG